MSTYVVDWALTQAPTANIYESHILTIMAGRADRDGCGVFPALDKMARACHCDKKTVRRHIRNLLARGIIGPGDPTSPGARKHAKIRADNRPNLYDILVPYEWYSAQMMADINEERAESGRAPLTPDSRPPIGAAPARPRRSDFGRKRGRKPETPPVSPDVGTGGDGVSSQVGTGGNDDFPSLGIAEREPFPPAETSTGGLRVPPPDGIPIDGKTGVRGDSESGRGGTQSPVAGGLRVPQTCKKNLSDKPVIGGASRRPPEPPAEITPARVALLPTDQRNPQGDLTTARAERGVLDEIGEPADAPPPRVPVRVLRVPTG